MSIIQRKVLERYLRPDEERLLFSTVAKFADVHARRDFAWMRLLRFSGIRLVTLSGLTVDDARCALRSGYLLVRPEINKGNNGYRVFVTKKCRTALGDLLRIRREVGFCEIADEPLILSRNHRAMSPRNYQLRFEHWVKLSGLTVKATPHWLRHTLGKRIMQQSTATDPRGIVQQSLGHSSINSTAIYTAPDRDDIESAMEEAC